MPVKEGKNMINISEKAMFHVHTARCRHATGTDREYVERAIELGSDEIWFTDHAPYPGDGVGKRMLFSELPEYIESLGSLRREYAKDISVKIGLEMEYFPSFDDYIRETRESGKFDILILGQHFCEYPDGSFYFARRDEDQANERFGLAAGMIDGIKSGYFDVVAHPDRIFRNCTEWTPEMAELSKGVIDAVLKTDMLLEKNYGSLVRKDHFWNEFWDMVPKSVKTVKGLDAHKVETLRYLDFDFTAIH